MKDNVKSLRDALASKRRKDAVEAAEKASDQMLNDAMSAETLPYQTLQLSRVLEKANGLYVSKYGGQPESTDSSIPATAAQSQLYKFQYNEETNTLNIDFDGDFIYTVMMDYTFSPETAEETFQALEGEQRANAFIQQENTRRMLPGQISYGQPDAKAFLPEPLKTGALAMALRFADKIEVPSIDDFKRVVFTELDTSSMSAILLERSKYELFNISGDKYSGYINLTMSDDENSTFAIRMRDVVDPGLMDKLTDVLFAEINLNHKIYRDYKPVDNGLAQRMQLANEILASSLENDPETAAYLRETVDEDPNYHRSVGNDKRAEELDSISNSDNVTSLPFRRR